MAGDWRIVLGPESSAERGSPRPGRPTLRTSVNTLTRLWLGVQPPSDLVLTAPDLDAPQELLRRLDRVLRLPPPHADWDM